MLISERPLGKRTREFLIRCESCGTEEWLPGKKCKFGGRRYCSKKCINLGRHKSEEQKKHLSDVSLGEKNHFFGKRHSKTSKEKMSETHSDLGGLYHMMKAKLSADEFDIYWSEYCSKFIGAKNPFFGKVHSSATRAKISITRSNLISSGQIDIKPSHYGLKGYYTSKKTGEVFRFDSFTEYIRMIVLDTDDNVTTWTKRHKIRIQYEFDGEQKNYIPDFLVAKIDGEVIEEVKGYENKKKKEAKFSALRAYCKEHGFGCSIVTYEDVRNMCLSHFGKSIDVLREQYKKGLFHG
ncbi:NUMOD3 domain-containing DNA-binding protein [Candidatus Pacearchaeota archaeon]|jgi:hypothetical protein|nr:NUMOD3 domain-containing DNA-binding protein [Candidatus Pacearchaeota archaeon]